MKWRKWFRILHRDIGYVAVALTLAYGLSGIAVNHIQWATIGSRHSAGTARAANIGARHCGAGCGSPAAISGVHARRTTADCCLHDHQARGRREQRDGAIAQP